MACRVGSVESFPKPMATCRLRDNKRIAPLQWLHNGCDGVSNHRRFTCLLNRLAGADQRIHQSSGSLAFVRGIHRWPVNYPPKGPVTRKMFPFDDVIMVMKFWYTIYCKNFTYEINLKPYICPFLLNHLPRLRCTNQTNTFISHYIDIIKDTIAS